MLASAAEPRHEEHTLRGTNGAEVYFVVWETRPDGPANFILKIDSRDRRPSLNITGGEPSFSNARAAVRRLLMRWNSRRP